MNFCASERPHPYGVKPSGNALLETNKYLLETRSRGLGRLQRLSDEVLIDFLGYFDAKELANLSVCSHALYVFSHHSDLWRDLTLKEFSGRQIDYHRTWKETFAFMTTGNKMKHSPLQIKGIFSDTLHRSWTCHTLDFSASFSGFMTNDDIPRILCEVGDIESFVKYFEEPNIPVVVKNVGNNWDAFGKWNREYLSSICGDKTFRATSATAPLAGRFSMEKYFQYASQADEEVPLYLFDKDLCSFAPLQSDFDYPYCFSSKLNPKTDLFRLFGEDRRPDHKWIVVGPYRSGSIFHIDPNQTNAWNITLQGRKKWIFYPPHMSPPGVLASSDGGDVTVPLSTGEWLLSFWKSHLENRRQFTPPCPPLEPVVIDKHSEYYEKYSQFQGPLELISYPGECVFVPQGYWHMVVNLDDDNIAITQNYVSSSNLAHCLRFLREHPDQISGVRKGSVNPDTMYEEFLAALSTVFTSDEIDRYLQQSHSLPRKESNCTKSLLKKKKKTSKKHAVYDSVTMVVDDQEKSSDGMENTAFSFGFF